jgi:hypothetical protein
VLLGSASIASLGYTAVASDEHNMLVALVRRPGETLHELLDRLERALGPARRAGLRRRDQCLSQDGAERTLTMQRACG